MEALYAFVTGTWLGMPMWVWLAFLATVLTLLALDLGLFHGEAHEPSLTESAISAGATMALGFSFSWVVWWMYSNGLGSPIEPVIDNAPTAALRGQAAWELYLTGWVVEQVLALDNVFVMSMIFTYFAIPPQYQHRVLFYGIFGVIVLRALMIGLGAALVHQFGWILFVFSAFLVFTGVKMLIMADQKPDMENNAVLRFMRRSMRITTQLDGQKFFVTRPDPVTGRFVSWATPLFAALVMIELADLIFAVDSVPAVFAITQDPFIVYTSNIFAILGLRSLYFVLAAMVHRFRYLKYSLALVLIYVGAKIFAEHLIGKIPPEVSLIVTFSLLAGGIAFSLWKTSQVASPGECVRRVGP